MTDAPSPDQSPLRAGAVLQDRYRILGVLGLGTKGNIYQANVYRARDMRFHEAVKLCAVKEKVNVEAGADLREEAARHFEREANILAMLYHPAIPDIYDYFSLGDRTYQVIEFMPGDDLEIMLNNTDGPLPVEQVRQWAVEICDVLDYLHNLKPEPIIFRDMKPANVMIDMHGHVRLIDFGIAAILRGGQKGEPLGTEGYAAPEQYHGEFSPQSDIYALGATLHHLLTRRDPRLDPPFSFWNRPIHLFNFNAPAGLVAIVERALAYHPEDRFATADEMKQALEALGSGGL
jgi:serine/threonine protein kinase